MSVYGRTDTFTCGAHQYTVTANELIRWTDCTTYCSDRNLVWAETQNKEEWKCVKSELMVLYMVDKRRPRRGWQPVPVGPGGPGPGYRQQLSLLEGNFTTERL